MESTPDPLELLVAGPVGPAFAFVLGALLGSFGNVCIARLPRGMSVVRPPSHCFACQAPVAWYDNLPIVSFLILRGRCRRCGAGYSPRYLFVEAATGALFLALWILCLRLEWTWDATPHRLARFAAYALFAFTMVVITLIDVDHKRIPDKITYPAIPTFLALGLLLRDRPWWDGLVGVAVGYGVVRAIADGYYYATGREGMGYGDGKLLAIIGGLLGWRAVLFSLFGGSLLGSVIGVAAIAWARRGGAAATPSAAPADPDAAPADPDAAPPLRHVEIPFGPFLATAGLAYLFFQTRVELELRFLFGS